MRAERENLRAALGYCLDTPGQQRAGLRLAGALYYFWFGCGEAREGRYWLERALAADPEPSRERVRALAAYGQVLLAAGRGAAIADPARECVELARRFDEPFYEFDALQRARSQRLLYRDDLAGRAAAAGAGGDPGRRARLARTRKRWHSPSCCLAVGKLFAGEPAAAAALADESAAICRAHGDQWYLSHRSRVRRQPGVGPRRGGPGGRLRPGEPAGMPASSTTRSARRTALEFLAWTAAAEQDYPRAARLLGAAARQRRDIGGDPVRRAVGAAPPAMRGRHPGRHSATPPTTPPTGSGSELDLDEAIAYALGENKPVTCHSGRSGHLNA